MKLTLKIFKLSLFIFMISLLGTGRLCGQVSRPFGPSYGFNTLQFLNGRFEVELQAKSFCSIEPDHLLRVRNISIVDMNTSLVEGLVMGICDTLRFYQTSISKPTVDDNGLSIWEIINEVTNKIPDGRWIESGWSKLKGDYLYYVKMVSVKKPEQFLKFNFFYIDNKLAFSLLQRSVLEDEKRYAVISAD